jgi:hypothetical protein
MSIAGNLKTMELSELLQWLSMSKKTGTLVVDDGRIQKQIFFQSGRIISSASTDPREHLGSFLISHGFISEQELTEAMRMQESNKMMLGKILTTVGAIAEQDLHRILRLKAEEGVFDVFTWPEGDFRFLDDKLPPGASMVPISLDVAAIVLEGLQRLDEWRNIRAAIPGPECIPVAIAELGEDTIAGAPQILAMVDDRNTVGDICAALHASEFHVCRVLLRQMLAGRLKVVRPRAGASPPAAPAPAAAASAAAPSAGPAGNGLVTGEALVGIAHRRLEERDLEAALRHARAARALDPDDPKVKAAAEKVEERLRQELGAFGMSMTAVPVLAMPMEEIAKLKLTPQEGFALTRIDGQSDLGSLIKLGPVPALDAQLLFWKLLRADLIRLHDRR